tara:strand:- start:194 stop:298 length:105 start_codon:yes stop_codon:yes gene_type:complete
MEAQEVKMTNKALAINIFLMALVLENYFSIEIIQ